jgi:transposase
LVDISRREKMATMTSKKRRQYTPEYQAEAVRLVKMGDRPLAQVARDLGLSMQTLWNWVHDRGKVDSRTRESGELSPTEREELKELRRRVARLEEEREILKKATAFFAKESK